MSRALPLAALRLIHGQYSQEVHPIHLSKQIVHRMSKRREKSRLQRLVGDAIRPSSNNVRFDTGDADVRLASQQG
jgi:hypothetical protein